MIAFSWLLIIILCSYIAIQIWQTISLFLYKDYILPEPEIWPEISILVAARDEESNIHDCLQSLVNLDYPKNSLRIVVGNDQSTDKTGEIIDSFTQQYSFIQKIDIEDDNLGLKAKARVMAQLDQHAMGEFYLVTDADVRVKADWAKFMIRHMKPETGVASGTTMVNGQNTLDRLQGIDWAYFMGLLNVISYSGVPATAVGNNMIVRSTAYWQTGGYANIRFSITEDYKLYSEICKAGWSWNNIMIPEVLAVSVPVKGSATLLHQRKRWLSGGKELPWYWWLLFGVFGLYYYLSIAGIFFMPKITLILMTVKWLIQTLQINRIFQLVGEKKPNLLEHLLYEMYLYLVTISTSIFFFLPFKTVWKKRKY